MFEYKCMHLFSKTKCTFKYKCIQVNAQGYGICKDVICKQYSVALIQIFDFKLYLGICQYDYANTDLIEISP